MRINASCQGLVGIAISALTLVNKAINTGKVTITVIKVRKSVVRVWFANGHLCGKNIQDMYKIEIKIINSVCIYLGLLSYNIPMVLTLSDAQPTTKITSTKSEYMILTQ
jgi:hypothetical protein